MPLLGDPEDVLEDTLAESPLTGDQSPIVVLKRPGHNLGR